MISAYSDNETRRTALERGADDLLTKPIDFERLRDEIEADWEQSHDRYGLDGR